MHAKILKFSISIVVFLSTYAVFKYSAQPQMPPSATSVVDLGKVPIGGANTFEILVSNSNWRKLTLLGIRTCCGLECSKAFPVSVSGHDNATLPIELAIGENAVPTEQLEYEIAITTRETGTTLLCTVRCIPVDDPSQSFDELTPIPMDATAAEASVVP
jgi:hypothetical protein